MSWRKVTCLTQPARRALATSSSSFSVPATAPLVESQLPKITTLDNGILVGSIETYAPISHVVVAVGAGPRHEQAHEKGVAHALRSYSCLSTTEATGFGLSRVLDASGSNMETVSTREHTIYHLQATRDHLEKGVSVLGQVVTHQAFKPWEVDGSKDHLYQELAYLAQDGGAQIAELAHEAAFRQTPLGRSLYIDECRIPGLNNDHLLSFVETHFTNDRISVLGLGVDHDDLLEDVAKYFSAARAEPSSPIDNNPVKFHGGSEIRRESASGVAHIALVAQAPGKNDPMAASFHVLAKILGTTARSKYSSNTTSSLLGAALVKAGSGGAACALNAAYSDGGLFGFTATTLAADAEKALRCGAEELNRLSSGDISDYSIEKAKRMVKADILMTAENITAVGKEMAIGLNETKAIPDPLALSVAVDAVTKESVLSAGKALVTSKDTFAMAAMGGIADLPYLDQVF